MKILNIAMRSCFTDGYSYQDNLLPEYQHKLGHDVTLLTSTSTRGKDGKPAKAQPGVTLLSNGVKLIRIKTGGFIRRLFGFYPSVQYYIKNESPDLIFIHGLASFVPAQAISYKKHHPAVCLKADNHQDEWNTTQGFPFSQLMIFWRRCWRTWSNYFSRIYGVTSWRTDFANQYYGIPYDKLDTLIMGVDNDKLPIDRSRLRQDIRNELGFGDNLFVFVNGGKLNVRKHTIEIMKAFTECHIPNIRLLLFGSIASDIKYSFHSILQKDNRIKHIGFIPSADVHRLFIASDFGLFPNSHSVLWEEACGCGLPCLFPKYSDHDHLQVCGNCIQIPPDAHPEDIREVICRVVNDKDYYISLKKNAIKAAPTFYYQEIARKSIER